MEVYVKGKSERLRIREALGIPELGKVVPRQEVRKSPRVEVDLALAYQPLTGKMVESQPLMGRMRDLGYHGALAQLVEPLPLYSEVKLAFELAAAWLSRRARSTRAWSRCASKAAGTSPASSSPRSAPRPAQDPALRADAHSGRVASKSL